MTPRASPAGVVLAAGLGTRLRPLTLIRPKPLCPLGSSTGLGLAWELLRPHCGTGPDRLAVNAFHLSEQVVAAVAEQVTVSVETTLMGTAGGLALLAGWRAGRDVLLVNGDAYLAPADPADGPETVLAPLLSGWSGETVRMLVRPVGCAEPADFAGSELAPCGENHAPGWRYVGACLMPGDLLDPIPTTPCGLFDPGWTPAREAGRFELVPHRGIAIDTGTPQGYLDANLRAAQRESARTGDVDGETPRNVVGLGAVVEGEIENCVVWPGSVVHRGETLRRAIRAGSADAPVTVLA